MALGDFFPFVQAMGDVLVEGRRCPVKFVGLRARHKLAQTICLSQKINKVKNFNNYKVKI